MALGYAPGAATFGQVYGGRFAAAVTGATPSPGADVTSSPGPTRNAAGTGSNGQAPAIAWVAILVGLIGIRILYEMGAKLD